ncbi:MAG TPA: hypothetical protein VH352_27085, partial [Pseudonocardiaceae bacterium]|nr:hypothetical protein [Pseudonocardiaceae bacterium]
IRLGERREKWHDQTTGPAGAMFNALFLASFALSLVLAWQAYQHAMADVGDEGSALTALYNDVGGLPNGDRLRGEIRDYANVVVNQEWPRLAYGGSAEAADLVLRHISEEILTVPTQQESGQATRLETIKVFDALNGARDLRLQDANGGLPSGLLICLVITAAVVPVHGLLVGLPHSLSSVIPLLTEAALLAGAVFVVFLIRRPYQGTLDIGPDQLRLAIARLDTAG